MNNKIITIILLGMLISMQPLAAHSIENTMDADWGSVVCSSPLNTNLSDVINKAPDNINNDDDEFNIIDVDEEEIEPHGLAYKVIYYGLVAFTISGYASGATGIVLHYLAAYGLIAPHPIIIATLGIITLISIGLSFIIQW